MDTKLFDKNCITLDGRMDEPVWEAVETHTDFCKLAGDGTTLDHSQTFFKFIPCQDRIYVGIKCMESEMDRVKAASDGTLNHVDSLELFLAPSGDPYDYYQFFISSKGSKEGRYWEETGVIRPDPYAPFWKTAIYYGEDYWSAEVELPLTAFYPTPQNRWTDKWLVNIGRTHMRKEGRMYSTWCPLKKGFNDPRNFRLLGGFPVRAPEDELFITSVQADIRSQDGDLYRGDLKLLVKCACGGEFEFTSDHSETVTVKLVPGVNEFTAPCFFDELTRFRVSVCLKRLSDGVAFQRRYPVIVTYEPIVIKFTKPEFRTNFYPGQDHSMIVGTATSAKAVTLKLEGPGIEPKVITPNADGSFVFETPNFEIGDAILTATIDGYETTKRIRNLPDTGHMMSWISGGNLIVNGKPVLRRNMYGEYYMGGEAFKRRFDSDNLHITREICRQSRHMEPSRLIKGVDAPGGEATLDKMPTPQMLALVDAILEENKDRDFAYYYISDEPECRGLSRIYLQHMYNYITEKDPYHVVLSSSRNAAELVNIADWFETHPYINPYVTPDGTRAYGRNINTLGKYVDDIAKLNRPDKCIGFLPTCFNGLGDYPTFDEFICHIWAAMIHGGKTLHSYAYHDMNDRASMYEGTRYVFSSFEALEQLVLFGKRTELVKDLEVHGVLYTTESEQMFVLVNMTNAPKTVVLDGISGTWHHFRHNETITGNTFQLKPLEVVIGTSQPKDIGLPTYQETDALINKLEYARTHGGSLLFDRAKDIPVVCSGYTRLARKLFDGVRDNLCFMMTGDKEKYLELDLTKVAPTFTKLVICGYNIADMDLTIKMNGAYVIPEIAEVSNEEFATTVLFKAPVSPEAIRVDFKSRCVELYEIELF